MARSKFHLHNRFIFTFPYDPTDKEQEVAAHERMPAHARETHIGLETTP